MNDLELYSLLFNFLVFNITILGSLVAASYIKEGFNSGVKIIINHVKRMVNTEFLFGLSYLDFMLFIFLFILLSTFFAIPGHDFVIISPPNFHAFISSLRSIFIGIIALIALPILVIGFLLLILMYAVLLIDAALELTGGRMSSFLSIILHYHRYIYFSPTWIFLM